MKSKGAIQFFAIAMALVCLFHLSFTFFTNQVEKDAEDYSGGDAKKEQRYLDSMSSEIVYSLGFTDFTYAECQSREINLGLDLQGGMHVTLEVNLVSLLRRLSGDNKSESFNKALQLANEKLATSQDDYITLFYESFKEVDPSASLFGLFDTRENRGRLERQAPDEQVIAFIRAEAKDAIDRTYENIRNRVDRFGVTQPNVRTTNNGRIIVELPGVEDTERVRKLLRSTAKLEFWETYTTQEILPYLEKINQAIKTVKDREGGSEADKPSATPNEFSFSSSDSVATTNSDSTAIAAGDSSASDSGEASGLLDLAAQDSNAVDTSNEALRRNNPLYTVLTPNINQQGQAGTGPIAGFASIKDTALINEYLSLPEVKAIIPADLNLSWTAKPVSEGSEFLQLIALRGRNNQPALDGDVIVDAREDFGQLSMTPEVNMEMNAEGAIKWQKITRENVGRSVAVVMDGFVYSFPNIISEIAGGRSNISGSFTIKEAKDLANILKAGKLPIKVSIIEEAVVGPTLGAKSIENGLLSLIAGFALVLVFMAFYYRKAGWVANLALLANLFFIIGVLSALEAALTLPGMAGIVLTIGMSVDANVLIFERIREELKAGKGLNSAIADGYKNALSSIIDANVTTLLTGFILLVFGKGPIAGFAVILVIGIITSLFSAIFISRLIFEWFLKREQGVAFGSEGTMAMFSNFNFDFIAKRRTAYIVSGLIIAAGIASLATRGLNYSVDFSGGDSYTVAFEEAIAEEKVKSALEASFGSSPEVKTFGADNVLKITTKYQGESVSTENEEVDRLAQFKAGLDELSVNYTIESQQKVGPTIADDIKVSAIWSVIVGLIGIFLYIILRFRKWQYGLGALAALFHDVMVVLSLFSIFWGILPFNLEIDQAFIAAILTVVGYSINDTVVVFDRIRESIAEGRRRSLVDTINLALNKTVSRTFITSITTLLVVLVLFIFGGEIIRGFSFALLVGVLVGTYSSLFIATPIVVDLDKKNADEDA